MPRWVATGQKIQKLISSWLTGSAIKEAKVKIDNCTVKVVYVGLSPLIADRIVFIFAGLVVNSIMIRLKAKELSSDPEFKASPGWYMKWKRCHAISMRSKTLLPWKHSLESRL